MEVKKTSLDGVLLITPPTMFEDFRGHYVETYNERLYQEAGITQRFIQDDLITSSQHVLRGFHGDLDTWKLISCPLGKLYLVVVNWDETSPQFRKWEAFTLSAANHLQVLVPPRFGNAHLVMSDIGQFMYKQTTEYGSQQFTLRWDDPALGVWWPVKTPILSKRDDLAPLAVTSQEVSHSV
jgi:dTDP-4-dehydrorhamnose 3,5-epimerase